jgi:hypothetical protein
MLVYPVATAPGTDPVATAPGADPVATALGADPVATALGADIVERGRFVEDQLALHVSSRCHGSA